MTDLSSKVSQLPVPDKAALAVSDQLRERILSEINRQGPIGFDRYWQLAMYEPGLGYYSAGAHKLGPAGDFVTAPELGSVFAQCLAKPVGAVVAELEAAKLLELGAGSGRFAFDLLTELRARKALPTSYWILEPSGDLRQRQQQLLEPFGALVEWLDHPPTRPWRGLIFGNEVVDALPAKRITKTATGWSELRVTAQDEQFGWCRAMVDSSLSEQIAALELPADLPVGYTTELQPSLRAWIKSITSGLEQGGLLLADYGYPRAEYYLADRTDGTLQCHYRHRAHHDPFLWPGLNDLTVSVDFTAVAEALDAADFEVDGFTNQAQFLIDCGIDQVIQNQTLVEAVSHANLMHQTKLLTLPAEMGEHIKFIGATRALKPLPGFAFNQLHRL